MAVTKVSLSLDKDLVEQARTLAGSRGLSALVNEALRVQLQHERIRRLLEEMDDEYGPVPEHVMEEVPSGVARPKRDRAVLAPERVILDSGAIIAWSRGDVRVRATVHRAVELGLDLRVPVVVLGDL